MAFFMDSEIPSADKIMEVFYILMGLMSVYAGVHNLRDRSNLSRVGVTAVYYIIKDNHLRRRYCGGDTSAAPARLAAPESSVQAVKEGE